ncbi:hypothetical protein [Streptococcus thoraltensis]
MIWWNLFLLFILSLLPYATKFAATFFMNYLAQAFYGVIVLAITFAFYGLGRATEQENPHATIRTSKAFFYAKALGYTIKVTSLLLGWLSPPLSWLPSS